MFEFAVMGSMFTVLAYSIWSTRRDLRWLGLFITGPVLLVLGMAVAVWYTEASELMPSLRSYWLVIHVTVATLATAVFTIGAALSVVYLLKDAFERSGRASVLDRFPETPAIERTAYSLHIVAFPLWTFTLIAGAIWARQAWASYWNWDPKEVWTFVIWVVYAAYLHSRATSGISRQTASYIALAGYACIIVNFAVVNVFFVGQHSYSGTRQHMLRYSVLRLLIFFGVLTLLWLLGLRDQDQQWMLLVLSALISMVLSFFVLARFREESTRQLAERLQRRAEAKQAGAPAVNGHDEAAEDAEDERGPVEYR